MCPMSASSFGLSFWGWELSKMKLKVLRPSGSSESTLANCLDVQWCIGMSKCSSAGILRANGPVKSVWHSKYSYHSHFFLSAGSLSIKYDIICSWCPEGDSHWLEILSEFGKGQMSMISAVDIHDMKRIYILMFCFCTTNICQLQMLVNLSHISASPTYVFWTCTLSFYENKSSQHNFSDSFSRFTKVDLQPQT